MATLFDSYGITEQAEVETPVEQALQNGKAPDRNLLAKANDTVIDTANAAAGLVKAGSDLISPGNTVSKFIDENIIKDGQSKQSDTKKFYRSQLESKLKEAGTNDGTTEGRWAAEGRKAAAQLGHAFTVDPLGTFGEIAGNIGPFAVIGTGMKAMQLANWAKTAITGGLAGGLSMGEVRGNIWDKVSQIPDAELTEMSPAYAELRKGGMQENEAKREIGANFMANLPELAAVGAIGALSGKYGVEGMAAGVFPKMGRVAAGAVGAIDEGFVQGGTEQLTSNYGVQRVNPKQSLIEDVGQNVVAEGLPGLAMGVATGSSNQNQVVEKLKESKDSGGVVSKAALAGAPIGAVPEVDALSSLAAQAESDIRQGGLGQIQDEKLRQGLIEALSTAKDTMRPTATRQAALQAIADTLSSFSTVESDSTIGKKDSIDGISGQPSEPSGLGAISQPSDTGTSLAPESELVDGLESNAERPQIDGMVQATGLPIGAPTETLSQPSMVGEPINGTWTAFAPESGTLNIPRKLMPQIKSEHRGAMTQFLAARGVPTETATVPASDLKPTQAEFSPAKVKQAEKFEGGDRPILVSEDGHILDGHHQWLAKRNKGEDVKVTWLMAPMDALLDLMEDFPSAGMTKPAKPIMAPIGASDTPLGGIPSGSVNRHSLSGNPVGNQSPSDSGATDSKNVSDLPGRKSFINQGFDGIDADTHASVQRHMLRISHNPEVLQSVIELIPIDVVNMLASQQLTPEMLFKNPSMLQGGGVRSDGNNTVSIPVDAATSIVRAMASVAAKNKPLFESSHPGLRPVDGDSALGAREDGATGVAGKIPGRHVVTPISDDLLGVDGGGTPSAPSSLQQTHVNSNTPRTTVAAPANITAAQAPAEVKGTAVYRKRIAQIAHFVNQGFTQVEESPNGVALVNPATNQAYPLAGSIKGVEATAAKNLLAKVTPAGYAEWQTNGVQNDGIGAAGAGLDQAGAGNAGTGTPNGGIGFSSVPQRYGRDGSSGTAAVRGVASNGRVENSALENTSLLDESIQSVEQYKTSRQQQLATATNPAVIAKLQKDIANAPKLSHPPQAELNAFAALKATWTDTFGKTPVIAYWDSSASASDGFELGGVTHINLSKPYMALQWTMGHEFKHAMGNGQSPHIQRLEELIWNQFTETGKKKFYEEFLHRPEGKKYANASANEIAHLREEMLAEFMGSRFTDKAWLKKLAKEKPYLFGEFIKEWIPMLDNMIRSLRSVIGLDQDSRKNVDKYIKDLEKAKRNAMDIAIAWAGQYQAMAKSGANNVIRSSQKLEDDIAQQEAWLDSKSKEAGYKDTEDMFSKNAKMFMALAKEWRETNPAEVLNSQKDIQAELQSELDDELNGVVSDESIKARGLHAEDAYADPEWNRRAGGLLQAKIPNLYAEGKEATLQLEPEANGLWGATMRGTWIGPADIEATGYATLKFAKAFVKRFIAGKELFKRGFDILTATDKATQITQAWKSIAEKDGSSRYNKDDTSGLPMKAIAQKLGITRNFDVNVITEKMDDNTIAYVLEFTDKSNGTDQSAMLEVNIKNGKKIGVAHTASLNRGGLGAGVYSLFAEFAASRDIQIHPDESLSGVNSYRRTEQMLSAALRTGRSNVMIPHAVQRVYGFNNSANTDAEHDANIARLLLAGLRNARELAPGLDKLHYNPEIGTFEDKGQFLDSKGKSAEATVKKMLMDGDARAFGLGRSTLARAVLTKDLLAGIDIKADKFVEPVLYSKRAVESDYAFIGDVRYSTRPVDFTSPEDRVEASTTVPRAMKNKQLVSDAVAEKWIIDAQDILASDTHLAAAEAAIRTYNSVDFADNKSAIQALHDTVVDNLLWLHNIMPEGVRARAKLWYDGANKIANGLADKYNIDTRQAAGVLAVLSPQRDWLMNTSLGERVIAIVQRHGNEPWSPAMTAWVNSYISASTTDAMHQARFPLIDLANRLEGRTLNSLSDKDAAKFVRIFDETYFPRSYRVVTPEGGFGEFVTSGSSEVDEDADEVPPGQVAWGSYKTIEKAISILRDNSSQMNRTISTALGGEHKVRNFFNNIIRPNSADGHVTIDTHAVAASLFKALSGASLEVSHNFGTTPKGAPGAGGNAASGASGLYGVFADAYRDAAEQLGMLPRELQSITWEAIRSIFTAGFKRKSADKVNSLYDRSAAGEITRQEARQQAYDMDGGIKPLSWEGTPEGLSVQDGGTSFDDNLNADPAQRQARTMMRGIQLSFEAKPGLSTGLMPGMGAPFQSAEAQKQYLMDMQRTLDQYGPAKLLWDAQHYSEKIGGAGWKGITGYSVQSTLKLPNSKQGIDKGAKAEIEFFLSSLGIVLAQEGMGWHAPNFDSDGIGLELNLGGKELTARQFEELYAAVRAEFNDYSLPPIPSDIGVRFLNFTNLSMADFETRLHKAIQQTSIDRIVKEANYDIQRRTNGADQSQEGVGGEVAGDADTARGTGRPDLQRRSGNVRSTFTTKGTRTWGFDGDLLTNNWGKGDVEYKATLLKAWKTLKKKADSKVPKTEAELYAYLNKLQDQVDKTNAKHAKLNKWGKSALTKEERFFGVGASYDFPKGTESDPRIPTAYFRNPPSKAHPNGTLQTLYSGNLEDSPTIRGPFFASTSPTYASGVPEAIKSIEGKKNHKAGPNVLPIYVFVKRPFDWRIEAHRFAVLSELKDATPEIENQLENGSFLAIESDEVMAAAQAAGFDSALVREDPDDVGYLNVMVFNPKDVTFAIGYKGQEILRSARDETTGLQPGRADIQRSGSSDPEGERSIPRYGKSIEGSTSGIGFHFSREPRTSLNSFFYGKGLKGLEAERLGGSENADIRPRTFFYVDTGNGVRAEAGVGSVGHRVQLDNLYHASKDELGIIRKNPGANNWERAILKAGFDGYIVDEKGFSQGYAVLVGMKHTAVPVEKFTPNGYQAPVAPPEPYKRGLLSRELNAIDIEAVKASAPSARLRMGTFSVDANELESAKAVLKSQGITLPELQHSARDISPSERRKKSIDALRRMRKCFG